MAKGHADFERKWAHIIKKAARDEVFKQRLISHPEQVLKENGIEVPLGVKIKIQENTKTTHYLTLPEAHMAKDLSEEELRKVVGGAAWVIHFAPKEVMSFEPKDVMSF